MDSDNFFIQKNKPPTLQRIKGRGETKASPHTKFVQNNKTVKNSRIQTSILSVIINLR